MLSLVPRCLLVKRAVVREEGDVIVVGLGVGVGLYTLPSKRLSKFCFCVTETFFLAPFCCHVPSFPLPLLAMGRNTDDVSYLITAKNQLRIDSEIEESRRS